MLHKLFVLLGAAAILFAQPPLKPPSALDKAQLATYLRHLFVWPDAIKMDINDPKPGPMAGFYEVKVRGSNGPQSQEEMFYVSKDGQKIVRGVVYDIAQNPFKSEIDKIKTAGQPSLWNHWRARSDRRVQRLRMPVLP